MAKRGVRDLRTPEKRNEKQQRTSAWSESTLVFQKERQALYIRPKIQVSLFMRNSGTLLRTYQALLCWCIPASVSVYSYSKVCSRVIQNVRGQSTGIIQEKDEISRLKNSANAVTGQEAAKSSERPISSMRIHIGGQPCYMKVNAEKSKKEESKMFSYIPGTVKCGFLIVAASLPKRMNESQLGSQKENEGDGTGAKMQCGETKNPGRHRSSTSLNVLPSSGTHLDVYDSRTAGRGGTANSARSSADSQSSFFLKPSKWPYGRNITRKSDSEFSNLRSFRRCALMPIQPRVNRSVSGEIHENNLTVTASDAPQLVTTIPHSNTPSITCEAPQNQTDVRIRRECKAVMQMLLNVLIYFVGWLPFFFVQIIEIWSPKELITYPTFAITFWARFCLTALNPFVVGYSSEELRKAFRSLIYCGHPKQEKKALKRLVLAGLGAAGIPYGRPIIPMRPHPVFERSSPTELT
ncbi:hypothetical protein T265_03164 [Opisthorchis viverrini]|uniref:G-protein coupled receptors family 1 profile domain-containing protein n=1 Tax=Opisthorchis viverrini TaxID=6198 RepID=A0A074ZTI3_OPIVI|nr:hypothetical protein T265_03164 [Opisthorchis viverrini]KER30431.1 hypothetical protein T265_03164 [Opisthorchis viverrini]